jgi:DNA-binding NarL/FixJ family response regulator
MRERVSVVLVEDDEMVRSWVRLALADSPFALAGEAATLREGFELLRRRRPDVLLVDYRLPDGLGAQLVRDLRRNGFAAPAVVMTASPVRGLNEEAREAGAQGTVVKTGRAEELREALARVLEGRDSFDVRHPRRPAGDAPLSRREREVLRLVAQGRTNREIGAALGIGAETVKTLLARAFAKLGVSRRAEAVFAAEKRGLL